MPSIAPVTINDGKATPAAHIFTPVEYKDGTVHYAEQATGVAPLGWNRLWHKLRPPIADRKVGGGMYRYTAALIGVKLEQTSASTDTGISPLPTKAWEAPFRVDIQVSERATEAECRDYRVMLANFLLSDVARDAVDKKQASW